MTAPQAVLFAYNFNSIRSPMAEALMKHLYGRSVFVDSAGVRPAEIDPFAIAVMDEIGIDLSKHRAKSFDDLDDLSFDVIVSLTPEAHHAAALITRNIACDIEYWPTQDPSLNQGSREQSLEAYRELRDDLMQRMIARFGKPGGVDV